MKSMGMFHWQEHLGEMTCPNEQVKLLNKVTLNIYSNYIPNQVKTIRPCEAPWITHNVKKFLRKKNHARKTFVRNGKPGDGSTNKNERDQLQSKYGTCYSVLIELPYFSPVRMEIVHPMHNLILGKHMLNIWKAQTIIDDKRFEQIDQRPQHIKAASDIGKLPTKLVGNNGTFTADERKNWVVLFSICALKGIILENHLKRWRNFVLACRYLCSRLITKNDIKLADTLLSKFCKSFEQLYGSNAVTPNTHLHCHLQEGLLDYGPVYSFWLFSFERDYGILGQTPSNKRLIEKQLMQGFIRDSFLYDANFPEQYQDQLLHKVNILLDPNDSGSLSQIGYETLHQTLHLASQNLDPKDDQWCNLNHMTYNPCPKPKSLSTRELHNITAMYKVLYPNSSINSHVSYSTMKHVYLGRELWLHSFTIKAVHQYNGILGWSNSNNKECVYQTNTRNNGILHAACRYHR